MNMNMFNKQLTTRPNLASSNLGPLSPSRFKQNLTSEKLFSWCDKNFESQSCIKKSGTILTAGGTLVVHD